MADTRCHARFKLEVDVTVRSATLGLIPGVSIEMSESGLSATLPLEVPVGETVDLRINRRLGRWSNEPSCETGTLFDMVLNLLTARTRMPSPFSPT